MVTPVEATYRVSSPDRVFPAGKVPSGSKGVRASAEAMAAWVSSGIWSSGRLVSR